MPPVRVGPVTPDARPLSTVSTHAGCGSDGSNDDEKLVGAACAGAAIANSVATAASSVLQTNRYVIVGASQLPSSRAPPDDNVVIR